MKTTRLLACVAAFAYVAQSHSNPPAVDSKALATPIKVNRTVPQTQPPKAGLEFSSHPTVEELFRARVFEEPLVPVGARPTPADNAALAAALLGYSKRSGPDDFSSLTDFLEKHPESPWQAALLTDLGLEYYNTAHYSLALDAWSKAWLLAEDITDAKGKAIADRAVGELAYLYARLGRMTELKALLKSVEGRVFLGSATEKITGAQEGLWSMQNRPEISFRCGPLALHRIKLAMDPQNSSTKEIYESASTQQGFSLPQVAELSNKIGLNYQMAFRSPPSPLGGEREGVRGDFVVPSVVHWKVGHYAAMVRQEGDRFLLEDPTFGNTVWATKQALEAETSGYFLIPSGTLPQGWREVENAEGGGIWGKGQTTGNDPGPTASCDPTTACDSCTGMAVSRVHLMPVSLNINDAPVGYSPPVGPAIVFKVTYSQRDAFQPGAFTYSNFGSKWTFNWISYITDNPQSPSADAKYYMMGGGTRTFTGFNPGKQTYASEQYNQSLLTRTSANSYQMLGRDGSKLVFSQSDGSVGTSRKIFLTQVIDPFGNVVALSYDGNLRIAAITDAIGQVSTLSYGLANDIYKITKITDPFGRFATFDYDGSNRLQKITDVIGLTSQFTYESSGDFINSLITPYGTTIFTRNAGAGNTRWLETLYPDGSRDRVEYNQTIPLPTSEPVAPAGMLTINQNLQYRNTYYWSRTACDSGYGDYSKAKIYHWLHTADLSTTAGIIESTKEALEGRIWYDYAGQSTAYSVGNTDHPSHMGRVLDDGQTQLHTYAYDAFGHVINMIDPVGRTFSYIYSTNGIDLLEVRQTRGTNNELLARMTYNAQHMPLTQIDVAAQTNTYTYNHRGQILTATNPKGETTTLTYDTEGYLVMVNGALPGTNNVITATYDFFGRLRTMTGLTGYTLTMDFDNLDRLIKITQPDSTFEQLIYTRLDPVVIQDRAGRQTLLEFDSMRQLTKETDPLSRVTYYQWCSCGDLKTLTDPMGRSTTWNKDVQGRLTSKQYGDGSSVNYFYENSSSRVRQVIDEKQQVTQYGYNRDDTVKSIAYANTAVPTPSVGFTYDLDYERPVSMTDGTGATLYSYVPIIASPALGAGQLASVHGPLANDTITYNYDELGRGIYRAINGVGSSMIYDPAGRPVSETNALGAFAYAYDGVTARLLTNTLPNGQTVEINYAGNLQDRALQRITHKVGATLVSEFIYGRDIPADRITTWSEQAGAQSPLIHTFGYDTANQLLSITLTNGGVSVSTVAYTYDPAGNRLTVQAGASNSSATYNALNQLSISTGPGVSRTNEWDAEDRLAAVNAGNQRTEFTYDGMSRMVSLRQLTNGVEAALRRFVWCGQEICEERDASGAVTKRFFPQGMKVETGANAGSYYYTHDHLGSIRELTDGSGTVRARYAYDPYGRRTKLTGDVDADFGFAGMFWSAEVNLNLTHFRAYDPKLGRWLSRDPLDDAEVMQGPNLYAYVANDPVNLVDPTGLARLPWDREFIESWRGRLTPAQFEILEAKFERRAPVMPRSAVSPPVKPNGGGLILRPKGELILRPKGELILRPKGELILRPKGELVRWQPPKRIVVQAPRIPRFTAPSSFSSAAGGFFAAGLTVLTMTDCNTVEGIFALARMSRGGMANKYADQLYKQIENDL